MTRDDANVLRTIVRPFFSWEFMRALEGAFGVISDVTSFRVIGCASSYYYYSRRRGWSYLEVAIFTSHLGLYDGIDFIGKTHLISIQRSKHR